MLSRSMVPFYVATALYWIYYIPSDQPGLAALLLKVIPTLCLYFGVKQGGVESHYLRNIARGLLASAAGDAALVWDSLFIVGILAFAVGHFFYIKALGYKGGLLGRDSVRSVGLGTILYGLALLIWYTMLRTGLQEDSVLKIGVPLYILWLTTTVWRSACVGDRTMFIGSALFMFSDACIGVNLFSVAIPYAQVWIMSTYQLGQYLIAMSAVKPARIPRVERPKRS